MLHISIDCEPHELNTHMNALGFRLRESPNLDTWTSGRSDSASAMAKILEAKRAKPGMSVDKLAAELLAEEQSHATAKRDEELSGNSGQLAPAGNPLADELTALERPEDLKAPEATAGATRVRGQPAPGKKRRTAAEVAEDLAYLQTPEGARAAAEGQRDELAHLQTPEGAAAANAALISTGEARVNPEDAAQDAADEAAETAVRAEGPLTLDDLRNAVMRYTDKHGVPAWVDNGRDIVGCAIVEVPPEKIADAISRVDYATEHGSETKVLAPATQQPTSLFGDDKRRSEFIGSDGKRITVIEEDFLPPPTATKDEVRLALRRYARKYDGTEDLTKAPNNDADSRAIVAQLFGAGNKIDDTPEGYGKTLAAIETAIRDNPYQRQVHP